MTREEDVGAEGDAGGTLESRMGWGKTGPGRGMGSSDME